MTCPDYYKQNGREAKDVIKPFLTQKQGAEAWYLGTALKYLYRYGNKTSEEPIKDLNKAKDYIDFVIDEIVDRNIKESESR